MMKKANSKDKERLDGMKEDIAKLKKENHRLRMENELLRNVLKPEEGKETKGKIRRYAKMYTKEID